MAKTTINKVPNIIVECISVTNFGDSASAKFVPEGVTRSPALDILGDYVIEITIPDHEQFTPGKKYILDFKPFEV